MEIPHSLTQLTSLVFSISYVAHHYLMHFGAVCMACMVICHCKQHHGCMQQAARQLRPMSSLVIYLGCLWFLGL